MRRLMFAGLAALAMTAVAVGSASAAEGEAELDTQPWSFSGIFGMFDRAALQRGLQVYREVCKNCHSMNLLAYRNLEALGYNRNEVKAIAAQDQVTAGPNDEGDMFERPAKPFDHFAPPFPNEQAARAANGGALPPDLSVIAKARVGGPDYIYSLLTGYEEPPQGFELLAGKQYNRVFPGHQIAMPQPLYDDSVTYQDGTPATLEQEAKDVATFLMWAAEPTLEERKHTGIKVILFLLVFTGLLYAAKRKIWSDVH
jgi:ubiquinol-cytochrome c reductase cytochrome c1 subunit